MKIRSILGIISLLCAQSAHGTVCKTQLIHACGSGIVEIEFDKNNKTFRLNNDDTPCWQLAMSVNGFLEPFSGSKYPYFLADDFQLIIDNGEDGAVKNYARFQYDPKLGVARLELLKKSTSLSTRYDLKCD